MEYKAFTLNEKLALAGVNTIREGADTYLQYGEIKILRPMCTLDIESKLNRIFNIKLIEDEK